MNERENLKAFLDGELGAEESARVLAAVAADESLAREMEELRDLGAALKAHRREYVPTGAESTFAALARAQAHASRDMAPKKSAPQWYGYAVGLALAACVAGILAVAPQFMAAKIGAKSAAQSVAVAAKQQGIVASHGPEVAFKARQNSFAQMIAPQSAKPLQNGSPGMVSVPTKGLQPGPIVDNKVENLQKRIAELEKANADLLKSTHSSQHGQPPASGALQGQIPVFPEVSAEQPSAASARAADPGAYSFSVRPSTGFGGGAVAAANTIQPVPALVLTAAKLQALEGQVTHLVAAMGGKAISSSQSGNVQALFAVRPNARQQMAMTYGGAGFMGGRGGPAAATTAVTATSGTADRAAANTAPGGAGGAAIAGRRPESGPTDTINGNRTFAFAAPTGPGRANSTNRGGFVSAKKTAENTSEAKTSTPPTRLEFEVDARKLDQLRAKIERILKGRGTLEVVPPSEGELDSVTLETQRLADLRSRRDHLLIEFLPEAPQVQALEEEIKRVETNLNAEKALRARAPVRIRVSFH